MLPKINLNCKNILKQNNYKLIHLIKRSKQTAQDQTKGYVIWAPDFPSDTPESNLLLSVPQDDSQLRLSNITPQNCLRAFVQNIIKYDSCIENFNTQGIFQKLSPQDFFNEVESKLFPLEYCTSVISLFNSIKPEIYKDQLMQDFRRTFNKYEKVRFQNQAIYSYLRDINLNAHNLIKPEKHLVSNYLVKCKLNGANIIGKNKEKLINLKEQIEKCKSEFDLNVSKASRSYSIKVTDPKVINALPDDLLLLTGNNFSVNITLHNYVHSRFLEFCPNQSLRYNVWHAFNNRASLTKEIKISNSINVEKLRVLRKDVSNLIGYETYANLSVETKMPVSVESIKDTLNLMHTKTRPIFEKNLNELKTFADENKLIDVNDLQPWDISFLRRRILKTKYKQKTDVSQYFPINAVLAGFFKLCEKLFNIKIEELKQKNFDAWNEDVRLFRIYSDEKFLGSFYFDPYQRHPSRKFEPQEPQLIEIIKKSDQFKTKPISVLLFNSKPMLQNQPLLLQFYQVIGLFKAFGRILQMTLSEVPYSEISGIYNLEKDHLDWISEFMGLWPLHDFKIAQSCSSHVESGELLPFENHQAIRQATYDLSSYNLTYEIYKSSLDLALYSNSEFWLDITKALWKMYMSPFEVKKNYQYPCSWSEIMTGDYPAIYFTKLWSQMVATDTFKAFQEVKEDEISQLGMKLKKDVIVNGGAIPARELFKSFRKRDPSIDPFLEISNLV